MSNSSLTAALAVLAGVYALSASPGSAEAGCNPPVIGCTLAEGCDPAVQPFLDVKPNELTVNYHDQCSGETSTRVFARRGTSGVFEQIKQDPYNSGGWRTARHAGLDPSTQYCFYVQTVYGGVTRSSAIKCRTTPAPVCPVPIIGGGPGSEPAFPSVTADSITVRYHDQCGYEQSTTVFARAASSSAWQVLKTEGTSSGWRNHTHSGLLPDTRYCYSIATLGPDGVVGYSTERCATTGLAMESRIFSSFEAADVLERFDWRTTSPVPEGPEAEPHLYYANLVLDGAESVRALRELGVHVEDEPIFPNELDGFSSDRTLAETFDGTPVGRWYFAVIPGSIYNGLRADAIARAELGGEPAIPALVFRRIHTYSARHGSIFRLSYDYLGQEGFDYNAISSCFIADGVEVCQTRQALFGWLIRKVVNIAVGTFDSTVEGVRNAIGVVTRVVKGEASLTLTFRLLNTDPAFKSATGPETAMLSAWQEQELTLAGVTVRARQGVASFSGKTGPTGQVTLSVAKNRDTRICLDLQTDEVKLSELFGTATVCVANLGQLSGAASRTVEVKKPYVNLLAQMTDTAEYSKQVLEHDPSRVTVLVGSWADRVSTNGRAFAPCMGRMPNLLLGSTAELIFPVLATVAEFLYSVDVVIPPAFNESRAVGVHEYAHTLMCSMMGADVHSAWTQVIAASASQSADQDESYLAEGFADWITAQVAGGTNYFSVPVHQASLHVSYSLPVTPAGAAALEENYSQALLSTETSAYEAQVRRVAALLQDAFDGHGEIGTAPNDGSHWASSGGVLELAPGNAAQAADEPVVMSGRCLGRVFQRWGARTDWLSEDTFLGSLAEVMIADGHSSATVCDVFALHESGGACPGWVSSLTTTPGSAPCTPADGSSGGGSSGGGGDADDPPLLQN